MDAAWDLVKDWSEEERQYLRDEVPKTAIHTKFRNKPLNDVAKEVLKISDAGLKARAQLNWEQVDESGFLAPLHKIVAQNSTSADRLLKLYKGEWNGNLCRLFEDQRISS